MQLDHVLKTYPCESPKSKQDMVGPMIYGDLIESWKLWRQTESEKEVEKTFKSKGTDEKYKKK